MPYSAKMENTLLLKNESKWSTMRPGDHSFQGDNRIQLIRKYQLKFSFRLIFWIAILVVLFILPIYLPRVFTPVFSALLGLVFAHGIELQHQTIHYNAFVNLKLNILVGRILGLPTMNSYTHYQCLHMWHHQNIGTVDDNEFFRSHRSNKKLSIGEFLRRFFGFQDTFMLILERIFLKPELPQKIFYRFGDKLVQIQKELHFYRIIFLCFLLAVIFNLISPVIFLNWILAICFYHFWHFLFEFPEHYLCAISEKEIYKNTRTIRGTDFSSYITNFNNFHVEHHLYPYLPMDHLGVVHSSICNKIENKNLSYFEFYEEHIWRNK